MLDSYAVGITSLPLTKTGGRLEQDADVATVDGSADCDDGPPILGGDENGGRRAVDRREQHGKLGDGG